jgi:[NiFe] hydrogenase diaphorase moiety large subunit
MDIVIAVQQRLGHVSNAAVKTIAAGLGIHPVEIEDMVSFYAFFDREPRGRNRIRLSKTPVSFMKGAKEVAQAFEQALGIQIGGTTADGMFTLQWTSDIGLADHEPAALVNGIALADLTPADVPLILAALWQAGETDPLPSYPPHLSDAEHLPKSVIRSSLVQAGALLSGSPVRAEGLKAALALTPEAVIEEITKSKLRGRGGAGFPTGMKWRLTRKATGVEHYIACNADEGEPGTFKDRLLLMENPDLVFDGMTIAGYALGGREGLLYLRGEYAYMWDDLQRVLTERQGGVRFRHPYPARRRRLHLR